MTRYIILLRGINVGGRNILPMKDFCKLLSGNGFQDVRYYIQSGNILARGKNASAKAITALIESAFGFSPHALLFKEADFLAAAESCPFDKEEGKTVHLYFCDNKPEPDREKINRYKHDSEELLIKDHVCYLYAPNGIGQSKLVANIKSCLNTTATGRNMNTIRKLQQMAQES